MKVSVDFGGWTATKALLALAGVLAIGGVVGSAVAFSPTIAPPVKWQGGAEFTRNSPGSQFVKLYTVPAGRNFLLTDLIIANLGESASSFILYSDPTATCTPGALVTRLGSTNVPPGENTVLAFQTGIGVAGGHGVCVAPTRELTFTGRGFLFTAAPAS